MDQSKTERSSSFTASAKVAAAQAALKQAQDELVASQAGAQHPADAQAAPVALPLPRKTGGGPTHAHDAPDVKALWFGGGK